MGLFDWLTPSVSGEEAAKLDYVHAGTDRRIGGELGRVLGRTQKKLSFKSETPPERHFEQIDDVLLEVAFPPGRYTRPHISIAVPRKNGRWATLRVGWRWDHLWGDEKTIGPNPQPEIVGGYIFDYVGKFNATQTFIAGREQG